MRRTQAVDILEMLVVRINGNAGVRKLGVSCSAVASRRRFERLAGTSGTLVVDHVDGVASVSGYAGCGCRDVAYVTFIEIEVV